MSSNGEEAELTPENVSLKEKLLEGESRKKHNTELGERTLSHGDKAFMEKSQGSNKIGITLWGEREEENDDDSREDIVGESFLVKKSEHAGHRDGYGDTDQDLERTKESFCKRSFGKMGPGGIRASVFSIMATAVGAVSIIFIFNAFFWIKSMGFLGSFVASLY
jgi:hypothetical protein